MQKNAFQGESGIPGKFPQRIRAVGRTPTMEPQETELCDISTISGVSPSLDYIGRLCHMLGKGILEATQDLPSPRFIMNRGSGTSQTHISFLSVMVR